MGFSGILRDSSGFFGILRDSLGFLEILRDSSGFFGILWDSLGFFGILWDSLGFLGILWDSLGFLVSPDVRMAATWLPAADWPPVSNESIHYANQVDNFGVKVGPQQRPVPERQMTKVAPPTGDKKSIAEMTCRGPEAGQSDSQRPRHFESSDSSGQVCSATPFGCGVGQVTT